MSGFNTIKKSRKRSHEIEEKLNVLNRELEKTKDIQEQPTVNTVSAGTITSGVMAPGTIAATQDVPGASFSYSQTYIQGDAVSQSAPSVGAVSNFSDQVSTAAGTAGDLAGTITTAGVMTITAGGAGTEATGQFVNELTVQ